MYEGRKSNNDVAIFCYHGNNVDILIIKSGTTVNRKFEFWVQYLSSTLQYRAKLVMKRHMATRTSKKSADHRNKI